MRLAVDMSADGIPVYVQPLLREGTVLRCLKDTPQEYVLVDSIKTLKNLMGQMNTRNEAV